MYTYVIYLSMIWNTIFKWQNVKVGYGIMQA